MHRRIQEFDWSTTSLGPFESWPQSLHWAVSVSLDSCFPLVVYAGRDLLVLYNDACSPYGGDRHPWVLGRPAREAWFDIWDVLGPDFERASGGQAVQCHDQLLAINRHGYTEECYFDYTLSPIRGVGGSIDGLFGTIVETTARVSGERRLKTLRDLAAAPDGPIPSVQQSCQIALNVLAENPHDLPLVLLYLLDEDKRWAKLAGATGVEPATPISPTTIDLDDTAAPWPLAQAAKRQGNVEINHLSSRLGKIVAGVWPEPIEQAVVLPVSRSGHQELAGFVVAGVSSRRSLDDHYRGFLELIASQIATSLAHARAYDEQRGRADALAELDRAKTHFFSNVSHEFRTPLALMLGPVEELLDQGENVAGPRSREMLTVVRRSGRRLLRLVNTLLDFSRLEAGRSSASYEPTALDVLTSELCSLFRSACERAQLRLVVDCPPLSQRVYVDREMWEKIVLNLLSNAFKFTFEGEITVSLREVGSAVQLTVGDMGMGIPAEEVPHLFERFHRIDSAHGRTHEGTGIGLALVQELVKLHGGSVAAASVIGQGSTFTVTLPLGSAHLPPERIREDSTSTSPHWEAETLADEALRWLEDVDEDTRNGFNGGATALPRPEQPSGDAAYREHRARDAHQALPRVLIAEDNADLRQYLIRLLSDAYEVRAVGDGEQALAMLERWQPELVLADVMMPRQDGFELLRKLRADPQRAALPVIMLSARADEQSQIEGLEAGADDYLAKPFGGRELLCRVAATLQMARLRRQASEQVRQGERRLQMALRAARMVAWEWDLADGTIQLSENAAEVLGVPSSASVENIEQWFSMIHPEDMQQHRAIVDKAVQSGSSYKSQFRMLRGDDASVIWLEERGDRIRSETGEVLRLVGIVMDVTERTLIEQTLQATHSRFETLVDTAPLGIYLIDSQMRLRQVNPKARPVFGERDQDLIGSDFVAIAHSLWSEPFADEVIQRFGETLQGGQPSFISQRSDPRPDQQSPQFYEWEIHRISLPDGQFGAVCYFTDVSRHVLAQQELAENDRRKDEFLATLAHELRNPLAPIRTGLELIRLAGDDFEMVEEVRRKMERQTLQLVRLVDDLLDVSRITKGKVVLKQECLELASVLQSAVDATRSAIEVAGHELSVSLPSEPIFVDGDPTRLAQVFSNLLTNAARYTQGAGHISLSAERQNDQVAITVADDGIGIPAEMLESIFEMFMQIDRSLERTQGGLGIGLTLVKRLVAMHGGSVQAHSEGPGQGSSFTVTLPVAMGAAAAPAGPVDPPVAPLAGLRILVVDDDHDTAKLLGAMVQRLGHEIRIAYDGLEALQAVTDFCPDVVLMDLGIPKLNGYDTARRIRQQCGDDLTLIAVTGWGQDEDRRRAREAGFDHHMVKPVEPAELSDVLASCGRTRQNE